MLDSTGERFIPWMEGSQIHYEHLHRYLFAASLVEGKHVLDLACGEGYGAYLLAERASQVVGMDQDIDVIRYASSRYIRSNLTFRQGAMERIPIEGAALFDAVICFEAIEHTDQHEALIQEIECVLKPDGFLVISSPNKEEYSDKPKYQNPFHRKELYLRDFLGLLKKHFTHVHLLGQRVYAGSHIWSPSGSTFKGEPLEFLVEREQKGKEFHLAPGHHKAPMYFIALASKDKLPLPHSQTLLIDVSDWLFKESQERIQVSEQQVAEREQTLKALQARFGEQIESLQHERSQAQRQLQEMEKQGHTLRTELAQVQEQFWNAQAYITTIQSGFGWKFLEKLRCLRPKLVPRQTRRERVFFLGLRALDIWWAQGFRMLLRRTLRRLGRRISRRYWRGRNKYAPVYAQRTSVGPLKKSRGAISAENREEITYAEWIAENEPDRNELGRQRGIAKTFAYRPLISIITPVYNTPPKVLKETIESVLGQTYDQWELCLVDGASKNPEVQRTLAEYAHKDDRIQVKFLDKNLGISGNSNEALSLVRGEFIALLDHDDLLAPFALFEAVKCLNENPELDFIYSDRDLVTEDGRQRFQPLFKPDWSPELMLSANYLTHLCIIRKHLVDEAGGFLPEMDGAQDWDLFFRATEKTGEIFHIPKILYHWRTNANSTALSWEAKPFASPAQLVAVQHHLQRTHLSADVSFDVSGLIRVKWEVTGDTRVSIIIPTKDNLQMLQRCLDSILQRTSYKNFEIILIDTGSTDPMIFEYYKEVSGEPRIQIINYDAPFNYSAVNNLAARYANGDVLLFLNNDTEILASEWLEEIVGWIKQQEIGVVGAKLLKPDGSIQHAGVILGLQGFAGHVFAGAPENYSGIFGHSGWYRNYLAVTGACMAVRKDVFEEIGGFNEDLALCGNDVEFCLRVRNYGYRVVYTPYVRLKHWEAATRGSVIPQKDFITSFYHYKKFLQNGDPYYSQNLSYWHTIPRLKTSNEMNPLVFAQSTTANTSEGASPKTQQALEAATRWVESLAQEARPVWSGYSREAFLLSVWHDFTQYDIKINRELLARNRGAIDIRSINWFLPPFRHVYYGGIYTILRFAAWLSESKGVRNHFIITGDCPNSQIASAIKSAFPVLRDAEVSGLPSYDRLSQLSSSDAAIATLWSTAYFVLKFNETKRKFYFIQDWERLFYPAGSSSGLVEATYRFGFYGIANTASLKELYEKEFGNVTEFFTPCVDTHIFYPDKNILSSSRHLTVFFYGRPEAPRNGFEMGVTALRRVKARLGANVRIVSAGSDWDPREFGLHGIVENLGLLQYEETAAVYRTCDVGLVLRFTPHPSYLPLELMASGCLVVSNYNAANTWLFQDGNNCLLSEPTLSCLAATIVHALANTELRRKITAEALAMIQEQYSSWEEQIEKIYSFMCDPESQDVEMK